MRKHSLLKTMLLLCALIVGSSSAWAEEETATLTLSSSKKFGTTSGSTLTDDKSNTWTCVGQSIQNSYISDYSGQQFGTSKTNNTYTFTADFSGKTVTSVSINAAAGNTTPTYDISVGGSSLKSGSLSKTSTTYSTGSISATGNVVITLNQNNAGKAVYLGEIKVTYSTGGGNTPSISADNVNIAYDADEGSIAYTINNPVDGGTLTASTEDDWLVLDDATTTSVPFICDPNSTANARTATVTLTYTYNEPEETVFKDVTITQAANPNVFHNISDITEVGTSYRVKGTVVALNARGLVIGDGTGYVYYYKGNDTGKSVGDKVTISGTTGTYGQIIQFTSSATIVEATTSNYDDTPAATAITAVPDYSSGYHLSDYFEYQGTLTKSSNDDYLITVGTSQIQISYPSSTQTTTLDGLLNKTVRVKGYFSGINSSSRFTTMLESIEEVIANPQTLTVIAVNGSVAITGKTLDGNGQCQIGEGTGVTATATANEHYTFTSWTADGFTLADATANPLVFTMPSNAATLTATFTEDPKHTATFYVLGAEAGTEVVYDGEAITFPSVTAPTGYTFAGWTKNEISDAQATAPADLTTSENMGDANVTFYAVFAEGSETIGWKRVAASDVSEEGVYAIITTNGKAFNGTVNSSGHGDVTTSAFAFDEKGEATAAPTGTLEIELQAVTGGYKMYNEDNGYLYASDAKSGCLSWHQTESSYWYYGSNNWKYASNGAYLRDYNDATIRTYGANNGSGPVAFAHKTTIQALSNYCTTVTKEIATVTSYGWATYIPSYAVEFPENRAYVVTAINGTSTTVATVTKVPARTPVLLKGEGEVTATILDEVVDAPTTNLLSIGTGTTPSGKYPYVLAKNGEGKAGFKLWTGAASVLKDRVVMLLDETIGGESRSFLFLEDGETTGVADINRETITNNGTFFDLQGRRVAQPTKGLYIVNGKKVVVK